MKKKYIKPFVVVETVQFECLMSAASEEIVEVAGEINDPSGYTINARPWEDWEEEDPLLPF